MKCCVYSIIREPKEVDSYCMSPLQATRFLLINFLRSLQFKPGRAIVLQDVEAAPLPLEIPIALQPNFYL